MNPTSGEPLSAFTIQGSGFGSNGTVTLNGQSVSTWNWSDTSINASVPNGAGSGNVVVTVGGVQSNAVAFTVLAPTISSLNPVSGAPGTTVTISGSYFDTTQGATGSVTFAGQPGSVGRWTDSSITVMVPPGAGSGNVVVNTDGGLQSNGVAFTVAPIVNSISPVNGEPGEAVTIAGNNFTSTTGTVTFNGQAATITNWSNTSIVATAPNGVTSGNVVVTAGSLSSNGAWFGVLRPAIASISPGAGNAGDSIQISGNYFGSGAGAVSFNGQTASVINWSDGSITVTAPAGATTGNVVVSHGGLQSNGINFIVGPYISSATPGNGTSGTNVTLNGFNFGNTFGGVTFNGTGASGSSWTNTSIAVTAPANVSSGPIVATTSGGQQSPPGPIFVVPRVNGIFGETDIGTVSTAGSTSVSGSAYTVSAYSGKLGGTADSLHYLYEPADGDFDMIVRATIQTASDFGMQYGITVRDSFAPGDVSFSCLGQSTNAAAIAYRTTVNGTGTNSAFGIGTVSPLWLRVRRYANTFQCLYSSNGSTWTQLQASGYAVPVSGQAVVGLSVMSDNQTLAQVVFDNVSLSNANTLPPSPWQQQDLGGVSAAGDATYNNGVFTVAANASSLSGAASDSGHFVYQAAAGDFDFKAHVGWVSNATVAGAAAGLMVRQSLAAEDMALSCLGLGAGGAALVYRGAPGLGNQVSAYGGTAVVGWVRMKRNGSLFTCSSSSDGVNWTEQIAVELNLSNQVEIGLLDGSLNGTLNVATFDSVSLAGVPGLPGPWQQQDIGSETAPGDASLSNNVFTVESNTYDISGTADNLHYVYQQVSGDLNIIAQVSWQNILDLPKAGVMVRQSLGASDLQYSCLALSSGAIYAIWRTSSGAADQVVSTNSSNLWVKINRHGNAFTCSSSPDGNTWTQVSSATVNMSSDVYAGLAQASGFGRYALVNYSNVTVQANLATVSITYPLAGSTVYLSQPVVVTVNATASAGASVTSVQYFEGQTLLGQASVPPYSLNIGAPAEGNHTYTAVVTDSTGLQATSFPVTATLANPQITSVSPQGGKAGTQVKINGVGFGGSPAGVQVSFNGVPAAITGFGNTEIDAIVPSGAGTGQMGIQWPDGANADGAPQFGPCANGGNCVVDVIVSPATVIADGQHPLSVTVVTSKPTQGIQLEQTLGLQCVPPETPLFAPGMPASGGCQNASATTTFTLSASGVGPFSSTSVATMIGALPCSIFGCQDSGVSQQVMLAGQGQANGSVQNGASCTDPVCGEPINLMTGNTYIQTGDYSLPGLGGGISIVRTWNSLWSNSGPLAPAGMFGDSWRSTYEDRIQTTTSGVNYWLDDGKVWRFTLNNGSYTLSSPVDARGTLSYNAGAGVYTLTFVNGTKKLFNNNGYLTQVVDRNGNAATVTYDTSNRISQVTDAANRNLNFNYGDSNNPNQVTSLQDAVGVIATYSYDATSHLMNVTYADNSQLNYSYDNHGLITSVTDALSKVLEAHTYDGQRRGTSSQLANGVEAVTVSYPQAGLSTTLDSAGNQSSYGYAQLGGEKTFVTNVSGPGCASCVLRGFNQYTYDASGNVLASFDANGVPTLFTYDSNANVTSRSTPLDNHLVTWQYTYNGFGELLTATDPLGNVTTNTYDANGNLHTVTTPAPDSQTPASVTDANNHMTQYGYDLESNLTSITDANRNVTTFQYDTQGHLTQTTFPSTLIEKYSYDNVGNLMTKLDRKNQTINYGYDTLNRLLSKTCNPAAPGCDTVSYSYDDASRLTQAQDASGTYAFAYDNMGRLKQTTMAYGFLSGNPFTVVYGYDAASNRTSLTDPNNSTTTYTYDTLNRLSNILDFNNNSFGFGYDAVSRRTQLTRPNGMNTNYGYDSVSNLLSVLHQQGTNTLDGATYTYDSAGNRKSKTNLLSNTISNFSYDNVYQLTGVTGPNAETYAYDPAGNRLTSQTVSNYAYNNSNQLTTAGSATYTYDNNGNTQTKTDATGTTTYTWDFENRLTGVQLPNSTTVSFKYDPFGRRIQKSGASTTNYVYDGANVIEEVDQSGNLLAQYSQGAGIDEPLSELRSGAVSYYEQDGLGSVTSLSGSGGALANTYTYDSFGDTLTSTGTVTNPYQYTGRDYDPETGLRYYRARYYDSTVGRFISEDPLLFNGGGPNFYPYADNDPVDLNDPQGLRTDVCCRPLRSRITGKLLGKNHCYVLIASEGQLHTYGLHRENDRGVKFPGGAQLVIDDGTDIGGTCAKVPDATACKERLFVQQAIANTNCPSCGANYWFLTTNSNYWVPNSLTNAGMTAPDFPGARNAPGYFYTPPTWPSPHVTESGWIK